MGQSSSKLLLFGGTGAIGSSVKEYFLSQGWEVLVITRGVSSDPNTLVWDPLSQSELSGSVLLGHGPFDAVCWAQGANCNDSIYSFDRSKHQAIYDANVTFILESLHFLLTNRCLSQPSRLCVISSIWQNMSRQNKLSYCVSKSAVQGLVLSLANDLASDGHLINAVLPGVLDTPMTRKNLSGAQIEKVISSTQFGRLSELNDVASMVYMLCSSMNTGVTGQFVNVDLGFSNVRVI